MELSVNEESKANDSLKGNLLFLSAFCNRHHCILGRSKAEVLGKLSKLAISVILNS